MSTTSTNFAFVIATTSDTVNVVSQIANNFTTIDSILSVAHTGTGELKAGLTLTSPTLITPTVSGALSAGNITGSTGKFDTITATGGAITANALAVGTYSFPATGGTTGQILEIDASGNLQFASNSPGTGANENLSNLSVVAINTNLNTFTAGVVTLTTLKADVITGTAGILSGLTAFQSTTGTFTDNLTVTGTVNAGAVNATGGAIKAATFSIGTYSYPATVGSTGQMLRVTTGNLVFASAQTSTGFAYFFMAAGTSVTNQLGAVTSLTITSSLYAPIGGISVAGTQITLNSAGFYLVSPSINISGTGIATGSIAILQMVHSGSHTYEMDSIAVYGENSLVKPMRKNLGNTVLVNATANAKLTMQILVTNQTFSSISAIASTGKSYVTITRVQTL